MSDILSLFFYIISFLISTFFYSLHNKQKKNKELYLFFAFMIPFFISSLRYNVGTDYKNYENMYQGIASGKIATRGFEVGTLLIYKVANILGNSQYVFAISAFLTLFFIFHAIEYVNKEYRTLVYFCYIFLYFPSSFNVIRQSLAMAIIFYGYKFLICKNIKKWCFTIMLATLFHSSAIICMPIYFLVTMRRQVIKLLIILIFFIMALNYQFFLDIISKKLPILAYYSSYAENNAQDSKNLLFFLHLIFLLLFFILRKPLLIRNKTNDIYLYLYAIAVILLLTGFVNVFLKRIALYFQLFEILLLANIPSIFIRRDRLLVRGVIATYALLMFIVSAYVLRHADIIPYNFIGGSR